MTQDALRRHHNEWLPQTATIRTAVHLPAQQVEVLRGRGAISHTHIVIRTELEESLQTCAGMFRTLALLAVRKQQDEAARLAPLRFRRDQKLIDDDLRAVAEIA